MHIPDHTLDPMTCLGTGAISAVALGYALYRVRTEPPERLRTLLAPSAACVFAAQMLNWPLPGGISGHLIGGVLASILLGPWGGMLTVAIVLTIQAFLFQDGGVMALGANVLNMAVVSAGVGYPIYYFTSRVLHGWPGRLLGAGLASWIAVLVGAAFCSLELSLGTSHDLSATLAAMLPAHAMIGVGEALVTSGAVALLLFVGHNAPADLAGWQLTAGRSTPLLAGLAAGLVMAAFLSPLASTLPDGLDAALERLGLQHLEATATWSPLKDYEVSSSTGFAAACSLAGALGTLATFLVSLGVSRVWIRAAGKSSLAPS